MEPVKRIPIVQQVVNNIKAYIFSDSVQEGDKLPTEKELCERLNVGRGTIREAFRILEATGYIEIKPGRGAIAVRVKEIQLEDVVSWFIEHEVEIKEFIEVRMGIEPMAIRLAIQRCSDSDITKLERIHNNFLAAVKENDISKIVMYDEEFHRTIIEYSRNVLLISISKQLDRHMKSFRSKSFYILENAQNAIQPHTDILKAFQDKDAEYGEKSMMRHLQYAEEDLIKSKKSNNISRC